MKRYILTAALAMAFGLGSMAQVSMPHLFTDGMVLQQKSSVPLWGSAKPGESVTVSNTWNTKSVSATADNSGRWKVDIETPCYGGPFAIIIKASNTVCINNVMIGEVWLASGQSNMEMPMEGWLPECPVQNGPEDIASSLNNDIRIFMVERAVSFNEEQDLQGAWKAASPQNTPKFGATCYYFAKKLNQELGVPVGIINTSWGGTPDESWIPEDFIRTVPEYTQKCALLDQARGKADNSMDWVKTHKSMDISAKTWDKYDLGDSRLKDAGFDDSNWKTTTVGRSWEDDNNIRTFDGVIWFRKHINIPNSMAGKELTLSLGNIDDMDITYFNGQEVGRTMQDGFWQMDRLYTIPANLVKAGDNVLAIRIVDTQGGGGMCGAADKFKIYPKGNESEAVKIDLSWKYLPVAEQVGTQYFVYDIDKQDFFDKPMLPIDLGAMTPTCLYNAMVAPIAGYRIAGAIWYQGEANVGRAEEYSRTFPVMINSWREKWQQGKFPFYFVQIAPWNYGLGPSYEIREAQRLSLSVENTGMASTMDIGNNENIHPANKTEVGDRLARIAFANVYNKGVAFSGPDFKSQQIAGNKIILSFKYDDGLYAKGGKLSDFEICGKDGKYYPADAVINGKTVEVSSPSVKKPLSVRYLWKNCVDKVTLYNSANLPASSFQSTNCWK